MTWTSLIANPFGSYGSPVLAKQDKERAIKNVIVKCLHPIWTDLTNYALIADHASPDLDYPPCLALWVFASFVLNWDPGA